MIGIFWAVIRLMISRVWDGDGGMPGLGSTWPATSSLKCLAKLGQESWKVTILVPAYGAIFPSHSLSFSANLASKAARFFSEVARPEGSISESFAAIDFAITRPLFGSVQ